MAGVSGGAKPKKTPATADAAPGVTPIVPVAVSVAALIDGVGSSAEMQARTGIQVTGPAKGRRRADRVFGPEPIVIPFAELGEDDLRAIDADPTLNWAVVQLPDAAENEDDD